MLDDAEKKIARLIRDSTTPGAASTPSYAIKVKGRGNVLAMGDINVTVNITAHPMASRHPDQLISLLPVQPAATDQQRQAIMEKCREIGDPDLYRPFIKAAYGATRLEDLAAVDLGRLEWWLGLRGERPPL